MNKLLLTLFAVTNLFFSVAHADWKYVNWKDPVDDDVVTQARKHSEDGVGEIVTECVIDKRGHASFTFTVKMGVSLKSYDGTFSNGVWRVDQHDVIPGVSMYSGGQGFSYMLDDDTREMMVNQAMRGNVLYVRSMDSSLNDVTRKFNLAGSSRAISRIMHTCRADRFIKNVTIRNIEKKICNNINVGELVQVYLGGTDVLGLVRVTEVDGMSYKGEIEREVETLQVREKGEIEVFKYNDIHGYYNADGCIQKIMPEGVQPVGWADTGSPTIPETVN